MAEDFRLGCRAYSEPQVFLALGKKTDASMSCKLGETLRKTFSGTLNVAVI